jgi:hypothetical protein
MEEAGAANTVLTLALAAGVPSSASDGLDRPMSANASAQSGCEDAYSPELEAQDPIFNRDVQAELRRQIADMEAGRNVVYNPRNRR